MSGYWKNWLFFGAICAIMLVCQMAQQPEHAAAQTVELSTPLERSELPFTTREIECVRRTVYGEAKGEPYQVQLAVAATIVNRSLSANWPDDLCKVVRQPNQFQGYSSVITLYGDAEIEAWDTALQASIVATTFYGTLPLDYRRALYFHTAGKGDWRKQHALLWTIGRMTFYGKSVYRRQIG